MQWWRSKACQRTYWLSERVRTTSAGGFLAGRNLYCPSYPWLLSADLYLVGHPSIYLSPSAGSPPWAPPCNSTLQSLSLLLKTRLKKQTLKKCLHTDMFSSSLQTKAFSVENVTCVHISFHRDPSAPDLKLLTSDTSSLFLPTRSTRVAVSSFSMWASLSSRQTFLWNLLQFLISS